MSNILFSFVMPAYNREQFIQKAIDCCVKQTYTNWELIIVDDCSSDNTLALAKKAAENNHKIKAFALTENSGASYARTFGINQSRGEVMVIADTDDFSYPNRLEVLSELYEKNPDASIAYTNFDVHDVVTNETAPRFFQPYNKELLNHINFMPNASSSFKKSDFLEIGGYDNELRMSEDYDLWLRFSKAGKEFVYSTFTLVKMVDAYEKLYSDIVSQNNQ